MGDPYTDVTVSGYNTSPPSDDGSEVASNRVAWSTVTGKVGGPLKAAIETMNSNVGGAVDKLIGGAGVTSTAINYTVQSSDQGKLVVVTASGRTITTPAAATEGSPFVFGVLNNSTGDATIDGSGSETVDGSASLTVPAGGGLILFTDGSNWFSAGANFGRTRVKPQGRLTLATGTPIVASDQASQTEVYFTPYQGNLIPLPNSDGTDFETVEFSELQLDLNSPNHVADTIYDVYVYNDSGTIKIATGPAWTTSTAGSGSRGTGGGTAELALLKGLYVNANSITVRNGATTETVDANEGLYVGTILIDGTAGQITCHISDNGDDRVWGVWNAYNRVKTVVRQREAATSWTITTAGWRAANNDSGNSFSVVCGLAEEWLSVLYTVGGDTDNAGVVGFNGIGKNSTSSTSGITAGSNNDPTQSAQLVSHYEEPPFIGLNTYTALENISTTSVFNFYGGEDDYLLRGEYWA